MAELFDASKQNVSLPLKNIFEDGALDADSVVKEALTTAADGKRYPTLLYKLDAILAVGYRVRLPRGVQFRHWASTVLNEYLIKGFVMDDERLKWRFDQKVRQKVRWPGMRCKHRRDAGGRLPHGSTARF